MSSERALDPIILSEGNDNFILTAMIEQVWLKVATLRFKRRPKEVSESQVSVIVCLM